MKIIRFNRVSLEDFENANKLNIIVRQTALEYIADIEGIDLSVGSYGFLGFRAHGETIDLCLENLCQIISKRVLIKYYAPNDKITVPELFLGRSHEKD